MISGDDRDDESQKAHLYPAHPDEPVRSMIHVLPRTTTVAVLDPERPFWCYCMFADRDLICVVLKGVLLGWSPFVRSGSGVPSAFCYDEYLTRSRERVSPSILRYSFVIRMPYQRMLPRFLTTAAITTPLLRQTIKKMAPVTHIGKFKPQLLVSRHPDPLDRADFSTPPHAPVLPRPQ